MITKRIKIVSVLRWMLLAGWLSSAPAFASVVSTGDVLPDEIPPSSSDPNARSTSSLAIGYEADGTVTVNENGTYRKLNVGYRLRMYRGTLNIVNDDIENPLRGTLYTPGSADGHFPGVFLGQAGRPASTVNIDGGIWDAPAEVFHVGVGGTSTINVTGAGVLNRDYTSPLGEITLDLGVIDPDDDSRGHGTLNLIDGRVTGNVVVGAGGDGVLHVGRDGVLGDGDYLTVGSGSNGYGTATFTDGATASNAYWTIGINGGTGTVTVSGTVVTPADLLSVRLGSNDGHGTLNVHGGSLEVRNLSLTHAHLGERGGNTTVHLDNGALTVHDAMSTAAWEGGTNTTTLEADSLLTTLGTASLGFNNSTVLMTITDSTWHATGDIETASGGGRADIILQNGSVWQHDDMEGEVVTLLTSGGDSGESSRDSLTTITLNGDAEWQLGVAALLSTFGRTVIELNDTSLWDAASGISVSTHSLYSETDLHIRDAAICHWRRGVSSVGSGDFNVTLDGGTFILGDDDYAGYLNPSWIDTFTGGTISVRGGGTIGGTLPALSGGMQVDVSRLSSGRLPDIAGGTLAVGELEVNEFGDPWIHQASGAIPGFSYDHLSLHNAGHMIVDTFHAGGPDFSWTGGHLESRGLLYLDTRTSGGYTDAYVVGEGWQLTVRGAEASADLSDAATAVLGNPYMMGSFGVVVVDDKAELTTAATDMRYGGGMNVDNSGHWTSEGAVWVAGSMMMPSQVILDGGDWNSQDSVLLGDSMEMGTGKVTIHPNGTWHAESGYGFDGSFGEVHIAGGTLIYGLNEDGKRLDFNPGDKLTSFDSGMLVVYGTLEGDINLAPGATLTASHVTGNVINGGLLLPGHSPAASLIEGDYIQQHSGVLEMEIYGTIAGTDHDTLEIRGDVMIESGFLSVRLGAYLPAPGQTFALFDWNWIPASGQFSGVQFVDRDGYAGTLDYETGVLTITEAGTQIDPDPVTIGSMDLDPYDGITLAFGGKAGHSYTLQFTTNLLTASEPPPIGWHAVHTMTSETTGVSVFHQSETPVGFYRVVSP